MLSPLLFNLALVLVVRKTNTEAWINTKSIQLVAHAGLVVLTSRSLDDLRRTIPRSQRLANTFELIKYKSRQDKIYEIYMGKSTEDYQLEEVDNFNYLFRICNTKE